MRILVINVHSTRNVGDAALLTMALSHLWAAFPGASITVAMNLPDTRHLAGGSGRLKVLPSFMAHMGYGSETSGIGRRLWAGIRILAAGMASAFNYRRGRHLPGWIHGDVGSLLAAYAEADLVVSCPGNIFASRSRVGLPFLLSALTVAYASLLRKPLYVMPQSIGPLVVGWQRTAVRWVYSPARVVQAREPVSFRLALEIGLDRARLHLVPDPALVLPAATPDEVTSACAELGIASVQPAIGVTAINRLLSRHDASVWERYEEAMAHALRTFLRRHGGCVVFYPQVTGPSEREDDRVAAHRIAGRMGSLTGVILVDDPLTPELLKGLYGRMDLFVATRLHSGIFAASMGVPTLFVEYLSKTRGLVELLGLDEWRLEVVGISGDTLLDRLEALWLHRAAVREHLGQILPTLEEQAMLAGRLIAEDYHGR